MAIIQRKLSELLTQIKTQIASETTLTANTVYVGLNPQELKHPPHTSYAIVSPLNFAKDDLSGEHPDGLVLAGQIQVTVWHNTGLDESNSDLYFLTDATYGVDTVLTDIIDALHFFDPNDGTDLYFVEPLQLASIGNFTTNVVENHCWGRADLVFDCLYNVAFS